MVVRTGRKRGTRYAYAGVQPPGSGLAFLGSVPARREYIECLAEYEVSVGRLDDTTGVWPEESELADFTAFCSEAYAATRELVDAASESGG